MNIPLLILLRAREIANAEQEGPAPGWPEVWLAFEGWPGFPKDASERKARDEWDRLSGGGENLAEIAACVAAHGRWLAGLNSKRLPSQGARMPSHPHRWLAERKWERHILPEMSGRGETNNEVHRQIERARAALGRYADELIRAGLREAELAAYFQNCSVIEGAPIIVVLEKSFFVSHVGGQLRPKIERAFGRDVVVELRAEKAA